MQAVAIKNNKDLEHIIPQREHSLMDKTTLKNIIVKLREEDKSFQEISSILKSEYGVDKTRQAVQAMYKRTIENIGNEINEIGITVDVVNMYCLGLSIQAIYDRLSAMENNNCDENNCASSITIYKIKSIILKNPDYITEVNEDKILIASDIIEKNGNIQDLKDSLSYYNIEPSDLVLRDLIEKATSVVIKRRALSVLRESIELLGDTSIAKTISNKHNLDISTSDISLCLNEL